ncbi:MAG TPA: protein kinase [Woeseiaceae bacterium]|nr:protein kinase [Woeseiaceae bacterium]
MKTEESIGTALSPDVEMSATLDDRVERTFTEQLAEFDSKLREQDDNAALLKDIHAAITALMAENGEREEDIREVLQKRYNGGKLRLETYQLVRNVLERVVIESMATMPDALDDAGADDVFSRTTVIESGKQEAGASQDRLQVGSVLRDRFLLQERVAGGSMGVVYKALDRRIAEADGVDPWVAIKVLSPKLSSNAHALRALQQEAAKGRCLSHPNIVRFIDLDRDDDIYFIVMEWLEGRSLAAILDDDRHRDVDLATALDIVRQVGHALDYAHRCGVVHADVKPANVMISQSGRVKLFDFGIARIKQKQPEGRKDFDPGVLGAVTPAYSSMQVLTGEDPLPADDVFSLGCLMYRLVAGHRVFGPRNAAEAAEQGMEPQRPHGLSDGQWRALKKSLAYSRMSRFATPAEFLEALDAEESRRQPASVHADEPIRVEPKPPVPETRRPWGIAAVLLVVVAAAVALVLQPELAGKLWSSAQSALNREPELAGNQPEGSGEDGTAADAPDASASEPVREPTASGPAAPSEREVAGMAQADGITELPPSAADEDTGAVTEPSADGELPAIADERDAGGTAAADGSSTFPMPPPGAEDSAAAAIPATVTVPLAVSGEPRAEFDLVLREDADEAVVELVRERNVGEPLAVLIEEVGFSGNQSPLTTGRYRLSEPVARFDAGQTTARFTVSMSSDSVREADRQATLLLRNAENSSSRLAIVNLTLQDDDQRAFESNLAQDTLGFAEAEVYVSERSPAVQVDVLRFNPGDAQLEARYTIGGGSATEGEDYFVPGAMGLVFGPGQRSARLLIPIVQDTLAEGEETFTLELATLPAAPLSNVHRRITIVIGDDDSF